MHRARHLVVDGASPSTGPMSVSVVECISSAVPSGHGWWAERCSQCWQAHFPSAAPSAGQYISSAAPGASPVLVQAPLRFHPSVGPSGSSASPSAIPDAVPSSDRVMVPMATLVALPVLNLALLPVRLPVFVLVPHPVMAYSSPSVIT
jgi:hypothetical protein